MRKSLNFFSLCLVVTSVSGVAQAQIVTRSGQLDHSFETVEVRPRPGSKPNSEIQATLGFRTKNPGSTPLRVAMVPPWPSIHLEEGIHMTVREFPMADFGIRGIYYDRYVTVANCATSAQNFTLLRPGDSLTANLVFDADLKGQAAPPSKWGRISGALLVETPGDGKCVLSSFSASKLPVSVSR